MAVGASEVRLEGLEGGPNAEERTEAMAGVDQVEVGLSRKEGESRTRMSGAERMPRMRALVVSSLVRMGPRLSALPGWGMVGVSGGVRLGKGGVVA